MIRIDEIHIEEFRGIRSLDLTLNGGNFGICGPNGTGKSIGPRKPSHMRPFRYSSA